jgi:hypothetical protein
VTAPVPRGLYGLALPGLDLPGWTVPAPGWVGATFARTVVDEPPARRRSLRTHRGSFPIGDGARVVLQRDPLGMEFRSSHDLRDDDLVHPYLSIAAAGPSYWLGRDPFHAGAVHGGDGAWMVAGRSGAGKSTLLAALALAGAAVLADDLVVLGDDGVFAGPRAVDLRPGAVVGLGAPARLVEARGGTRARLPLGAVPTQLPLVGWIDLAWGSSVSVTPLPVDERLRRLARRRTFPAKLPPGNTLLDLVGLPGYLLRRPRSFDAVADTVAAVADLTGARLSLSAG